MPAVLNLSPAAERSVPIALGDAGTIELRIRPLTLSEELTATIHDDPMGFRIERSIVGWEGAIDEFGKPIPYSPEALAEVTRQFPAARIPITFAVIGGKEQRDTDAKNSVPPSSDSCGTATADN